MKDEKSDIQTTRQQEARAKLRETFLKAVNVLNGETCTVLTFEQSTLAGTFSGWKPDGTDILISDLKTPANIKMASALLRNSDILAIKFDNLVQLPF
ncbi:unnamed protein product [Parnassius apollo]|uniref:(apollo) hypothetical protein n=1 Tax=Parnassius apollo TaxID=110799 RepID=A0A8S3Y259_PARAO|nr:unnamed protein product [Parnassius apollo]